ncbi:MULTISPECIES: VC0807 family protein [Mumia]|nr:MULTISPECIES: VC0807 family protein [Mumia]
MRDEHAIAISAPRSRDVLARVVGSLFVAAIVPGVLLWTMLQLFNVAVAVIAVLAWMLVAMGWRYATKRPVSVLLLLTLGILTIKTAFTLVSGNTFVYFVQPVIADVIVAVIFLGSLWTARPIIARIAPDFYPLSASTAAHPEIRALFRRLTLMWGAVILAKGAITLWLLLSLSTASFVLIKGGAVFTLTVVATVVTIVWSAAVVRRQSPLQPA